MFKSNSKQMPTWKSIASGRTWSIWMQKSYETKLILTSTTNESKLGKWNLPLNQQNMPLNLKNNQIPMINISIVPRSCIQRCTWDKMLNPLLTVFYWSLITTSQDLYPKNHFSFWQYSFIYQISSYNYQIRKMTKNGQYYN